MADKAMTKQQQAEVIADEIVKQVGNISAQCALPPATYDLITASMLAVANTTIRTFGRYAENPALSGLGLGLRLGGGSPSHNPPR